MSDPTMDDQLIIVDNEHPRWLTDDRHRIEVSLWESELDGVPLIIIETTELTGKFRVLVNDGIIWNADAEKHAHVRCRCSHEDI